MIELAEQSGISSALLRQPGLAVEIKADQTPVTWPTRGAEELSRNDRSRFPSHG